VGCIDIALFSSEHAANSISGAIRRREDVKTVRTTEQGNSGARPNKCCIRFPLLAMQKESIVPTNVILLGMPAEQGNAMKRREFLKAASVGVAVSAGAAQAMAQSPGTTFLVAHGAWSAGWAWKRMHPLMSAAGHRLITPTYTGIGERDHLASASNDLETHIQDVLAVMKYEDLRDVVLIGHSYGGMVATGVADRASDRISQLIYLDAFVPRDGQALIDLIPPEGRVRMQESVKAGDGWRVPPNPTPPDTSEADVKWIAERRLPQSYKCFEMPLRLRNPETTLPRSYIYCKRIAPVDTFRQFAERAKSERGWRYYEIDASHSPHVTAPEALAALLLTIVSERV
jgi:pimeloyl-ACP methyl ester carboxylesterase